MTTIRQPRHETQAEGPGIGPVQEDLLTLRKRRAIVARVQPSSSEISSGVVMTPRETTNWPDR